MRRNLAPRRNAKPWPSSKFTDGRHKPMLFRCKIFRVELLNSLPVTPDRRAMQRFCAVKPTKRAIGASTTAAAWR